MRLDEIEWTDLELRPEDVLRGGGPSDPSAPTDWAGFELRLGRPIVLEARKYLKDDKTADRAIDLLKSESDFYYVRIPVSVKPTERWSVGNLGLTVDLANPGGAIAWSMSPERVDQEQKLSTSARLEPSLKIDKVEVSLGALESGKEYITYQPSIYAYNLGTSSPAWEFTPTSGKQVRGVQLLHLVVQQPRRSRTDGRIRATVELRREGGLLRRLLGYRKGAAEDHMSFTIA